MLVVKKEQMEEMEIPLRKAFAKKIEPLLLQRYPYPMFQLQNQYETQIDILITNAAHWKIKTEQELAKFILIAFELGFEFWKNPEHRHITHLLNSRYIPIEDRLSEITEIVLP